MANSIEVSGATQTYICAPQKPLERRTVHETIFSVERHWGISYDSVRSSIGLFPFYIEMCQVKAGIVHLLYFFQQFRRGKRVSPIDTTSAFFPFPASDSVSYIMRRTNPPQGITVIVSEGIKGFSGVINPHRPEKFCKPI